MQEKDTRSEPSERLEVAFTDKPVSGWGGLVAMARFFDKRGVCELLTGRARRFAHVERHREDETVRGILGVKRLPSAMSLTRYSGASRRRGCARRCWA